MAVSWSHFPEHKGRISGIIISGFGFGSSIFSIVATLIINPSNKKADIIHDGYKYFGPEIYENFPSMLRWLAFIYFLLSSVGVAMLARPIKKAEDSLELENLKDKECPSVTTGIKSQEFWLLFVMATCSTTAGLFFANSFKTFGNIVFNDDKFLAVVGSVGSIFDGSFRFIWGQTMDKTSFKFAYFALVALQTGLLATLNYIASVKILYLFWVSLILCCKGGNFSLFPTVIAKLYGKQ